MDAARHRHVPVHLSALFVLAVLVSGIHARDKQGDVLRRLFKAKSGGSGAVDTGLFLQESGDRADGEVESFLYPQEGSKENDKITSLPGQPPVDFDQYGGYVTVSPSAGCALFYYFVEASRSKESLPLILWLNGGPGCSSLAYGAMEELGPFRVYSDGKTLYRNKYSWNLVANVIFLESPVGVGFSYSNTTSDYKDRGDKNTAKDNYIFLLNWLERFPEYKGRDFYLTGESYAGHYVPQLAHHIISHDKEKAGDPSHINFKGIMIGNAVINDETDTRGMYAYIASHALISSEMGEVIQKYCNFSPEATTQTDQCTNAVSDVNDDVGDLNIYNIYAPLCLSSNLTARPRKASAANFDPCSDNYVHAYLNRPDVQQALHANVTKLTYDWEPCSEVINGWGDSPDTIIPQLREIMAKGLRLWIYSGDVDGRVPVTSTQYSIAAMKLPIKTGWHPWYLNSEVGGYTQVYKGDITFATVRGAGHEVPSYQPSRALALVSHFLKDTHLPY